MPPQHQHEDISPLDRYGHDLTALAQQGAFAPLAGHDDRIAYRLTTCLTHVCPFSCTKARGAALREPA